MKKIAIFAVVMVVGAGIALAATLNVPFFLDDSGQSVDGFIGVKEAAGVNQTLTVVYTSLDASNNPQDQTVTFAVGANRQVSWQPVQSTGQEGDGSLVGNMSIAGRTFGSAKLISGSANGISGRYVELRGTKAFSYVLIP